MRVLAPEKFLGDLSRYLGGAISFDTKNVNQVAPDLASSPWFGTVTITGSNGSASLAIAGTGPGNPPNDNAWHHYSVALVPDIWSGDLVSALSMVTELSIVLEFNDTIVEPVGFDNFRVTPVPGAVWLLASALFVLFGVARIKR